MRLTFLIALLATAAWSAPLPLPYPADQRMMAFCFEGPAQRPVDDPMAQMAEVGANWVSLTPFSFMPSDEEPSLNFRTDTGWWGERDEGIIQSIDWAHAAGMKVMLKPHIWLRPRDGQWRGTISMDSEEEWAQWFENYTRWMLHNADLAEAHGAEILVVGHELTTASLAPEAEPHWRALIAEVREHYSGAVIWSAHWDGEFERLPFWDALDAMGVGVYFPVSSEPDPTHSTMQGTWDSAARRIGEIATEHGLPVIFTEFGYRSSADAAARPWEWRSEAPQDLELQRDLYEAMFRACADEPWFAGVFVWKWQTEEMLQRRDVARDFTPQGKPAMQTLREWFPRAVEPTP